jgi:hypothetical protein
MNESTAATLAKKHALMTSYLNCKPYEVACAGYKNEDVFTHYGDEYLVLDNEENLLEGLFLTTLEHKSYKGFHIYKFTNYHQRHKEQSKLQKLETLKHEQK